jgi:LemA protein
MVWLFVLIGLVVVVALVVLVGFNALRSAEQGVKKDWNNITTELQRRADLIPNLVETVKQYAAHERELFEQVTAARAAAGRVPSDPAHAGDVAAAQDLLTGSLGRLIAVAENYPDLKASDNFRQLQGELTDTEDRIAASRKLYNSSVEHLNTKARTFPTNLMTGLAGVGVAAYYTVSEAEQARIAQAPNVGDLF